MVTVPAAPTAEVVVLDYEELTSSTSNLRETMEKAYGMDGAGILAIRNVPGFVEAKEELLSMAHPLAHLPAEALQELEDPSSLYNSGWSHGKEKLKAEKPDWNKASFYFNPLTDQPGTEEDRKAFPLSYPTNKWPNQDMPALEPAAKRLGSLMKDVAVLVARHIDDYALQRNPSYTPDALFNAMADTEKVKGRLLYYYPLPGGDGASEDSWIGWHNDSGFLTALAGDMYLSPDGQKLSGSPSPEAGLYVVDRQDRVVQVRLPSDCMAIQMGECTQILTGGAVVATPHCVRGAPNIARVSLACFIDTPPTFRLSCPGGSSGNEGNDSTSLVGKTSSRVPLLAKRWTNNMTFGEFLEKTFQIYYESK